MIVWGGSVDDYNAPPGPLVSIRFGPQDSRVVWGAEFATRFMQVRIPPRTFLGNFSVDTYFDEPSAGMHMRDHLMGHKGESIKLGRMRFHQMGRQTQHPQSDGT